MGHNRWTLAAVVVVAMVVMVYLNVDISLHILSQMETTVWNL
jgi:hypothetical protein